MAFHTITDVDVDGTYNHLQSTPSNSWNIAHNLGSTSFATRVLNSNNETVTPTQIVVVDSNNITVEFDSPVSGQIDVSTGSNAFILGGIDVVVRIPPISRVRVSASTTNIDGFYTVSSVSLVGSDTHVVVQEAIPSTTGDGLLQDGSYDVNFYTSPAIDSSKDPFVVIPFQLDSTTSIKLPGRQFDGYGETLNENYLHILENFSGPTAPNGPTTGQMWYDTSTTPRRLKIYEHSTTSWTDILTGLGDYTVTGNSFILTKSTGEISYTATFDTHNLVLFNNSLEAGLRDSTWNNIISKSRSNNELYIGNSSTRPIAEVDGTFIIQKAGTDNIPTLKVINPLGTNSYGVVAELEISDTSASPIDRPSLLFTSRADATTKTWSIGYHSGVGHNLTSSTGFRIAEDHSTSGWGKDRLFIEPDGTNTLNLYNNGIGLSATNETEMCIQVGEGRTADGYAYIDLIGDATYTDYGLRIIRDNLGPDSNSHIYHRGNGLIDINASDRAASINIGHDPSRVAVYKDLDVMGFDLTLGSDDQITRGNSGASRALVKNTGSTLYINFANDFSGGTVIDSDLTVTGSFNVGSQTISNLELLDATPYIDFKDSGVEDYDSRIILNGAGFARGLDFLSVGSSDFNFRVNNGSLTCMSIGASRIDVPTLRLRLSTNPSNSAPIDQRLQFGSSERMSIGDRDAYFHYHAITGHKFYANAADTDASTGQQRFEVVDSGVRIGNTTNTPIRQSNNISQMYAGQCPSSTVNGNVPGVYPTGWTVDRVSVGVYRINHNIGTANYIINSNARVSGTNAIVDVSWTNKTPTSVDVILGDTGDGFNRNDSPFDFMVMVN